MPNPHDEFDDDDHNWLEDFMNSYEQHDQAPHDQSPEGDWKPTLENYNALHHLATRVLTPNSIGVLTVVLSLGHSRYLATIANLLNGDDDNRHHLLNERESSGQSAAGSPP